MIENYRGNSDQNIVLGVLENLAGRMWLRMARLPYSRDPSTVIIIINTLFYEIPQITRNIA
jgi:hypothetical protein